MASLLDLEKKLHDLFNQGAQQVGKVAQNTANNANFNFWHSPAGQGMVNAQKFIQSPQSINLPQVPNFINQHTQVHTPMGNIEPLKIARDIANVPASWAANTVSDAANNIGRTISGQSLEGYKQLKSPVTKLGYNIGGAINPDSAKQLGVKQTPQQILGNAAGAIQGPLSVYGGGKVLGLGKEAMTQVGQRSLANSFIRHGAGASKVAGLYGLLEGLANNKDETLSKQVTEGAKQGATNAAGGFLLGGTLGAGATTVGNVKTGLTKLLMDKHGMNQKQAEQALSQFARDEVGRFTGKKVVQKFDIPNLLPNMKAPKEAPAMSMTNPGYSAARGKLFTKSTVRSEPTYYSTLRTAINDNMPQPGLSIKTVSKAQHDAGIPIGKERGFATSVHESPQLAVPTMLKTKGFYTPKENDTLMGEAKALMSDGASINFKGVKDVDQKVSAAIQEAINLDAQGNHEAAANLFNNLAEHGTELGRGVQAFSLLDKMSPEAISLSVAGKINRYNRTAARPIPQLTGEQQQQISGMVDKIQGMQLGRDRNIAINELQKVIDGYIPSTLVDKAIAVWKAGLLTSLRTHERNIAGNTIMGGSEIGKDVIASPIDQLMALKTGKRTLTLNTQGLGEGTKKGLQASKDIIQRGYDPEQTISKFDQKTVTWGNNPFEQALKKGTDAVFRTLGGEDKPFLHGATARSLYDQAKAEAINAGRQGDQEYIEELVANPTEQMINTAAKEADYATFHDKNMLSDVASAIKRAASLPENGKWGEFGKAVTEILAPFTGVPSSIVGKTIDYSPIGLAKGTVNVGRVLAGQVPELQRQAAQEVGRGVIGTGLFGLGAYLMSKGLMTGQPKDVDEANLWAAENKQANSVLIDGKWRSINSIGPQNLVMLAGAKYAEEMGKPDGSATAYAASLGKDQLSQTFLQGVQGPLNAISDPKRFAQSYVGNQAASVVPNIVKDLAKSQDPNQRENNNIGDYISNSLPGRQDRGIEKRDVLGNIVPQEPTGAGAFLDLFNSKTPINNPIVDELSRLNSTGNDATPSKLDKTQTIQGEKMKLTPEQLNVLESQLGPQAQSALQNLFQAPDYQSLPDEDKAKAVSSLLESVRKQVRGTADLSQAPSASGNVTIAGGGNTASDGIGQQYTLVNQETGTVKRIDLSKEINSPALTGNTELDKKLMSKYNGELTSRANDIVALYQAGKITAEQAGKYLDDLKSQKGGGKGKKPKGIAISKIKAASVRISKFAHSKQPKIKIGKSRSAVHISSAKKTQIAPPKASFAYTIKSPQLKGLTKGIKIV
jgi:hypothetical protein